MTTERRAALTTGTCLLVAYGVLTGEMTSYRAITIAAEVISGAAVAFLAIVLYPVFARDDRRLAVTFTVVRTTEGIGIALAALLLLSGDPAFSRLRGLTYAVHTYAFIASDTIFYLLFYRLRLVPRWISVWGMAALALLLVTNLLDHAGSPLSFGMALYLPIVLNEVLLAVWLIVKGFSPPSRGVPLRPADEVARGTGAAPARPGS